MLHHPVIHRFGLMRFENVSDEEFDLQLRMPEFGMITGGTTVLSCDIGILEELQLDEAERDAKKEKANQYFKYPLVLLKFERLN